MAAPILTNEQLISLAEYERLRDAPRNAVEAGVYPNGQRALAAYAALDEALKGDLNEWADQNTASMKNVAAKIPELIAAFQAVQDKIEEIARLDPLVFPNIYAQLQAAEAGEEIEPTTQ